MGTVSRRLKMWLELFPPSLGTLNSLYHSDVFQTFFKLHLTVKNVLHHDPL